MTQEAAVKILADLNAFPMEEYEPAPEIFIDGMGAYTVTAGVAKINCFSIYVDHENHTKRRIVLRLAMPVPLLPSVQTYLGQAVETLTKAGAMVSIPAIKQ